MRRWRLAAVICSVSVIGALGLPLSAEISVAAPPDAGWTGSGTGTTRVVNDGSTGEAIFAYDNFAPFQGGSGASGTWEFSTTASSTGTVELDYLYSGFHAFFQVTLGLEAFVSRASVDVSVQPIVATGPVDCCTMPSGGFSYNGNVALNVEAGDRYGFRMSGSNADLNSRLRGRLIVDQRGSLGSDIRVLNGYDAARTEGDLGITESSFAITRNYLTDANNFGGSEPVVSTGYVFGSGVDTATPESLLGTDVFITGSVASSSYTPAEKQALVDFVKGGGVLIATADDTGVSMVDAFGLTQGDGAAFTSTFVSATHPIADGPFGTDTDFVEYESEGSFFGLGPDAVALALDGASRPTLAEIPPGTLDATPGTLGNTSGLAIFLADVDFFTDTSYGAFDNEVLIKNLFAYAAAPATEPPDTSPGEVTLIQAVPAGNQTIVALIAGGTPGDTTTVELLTSNTCVGGALGAPSMFATVDVTFDSAGQASFYGSVATIPGEARSTYVAAWLVDNETAGPASSCIVAGPDNDAWTRALALPLSGTGSSSTGSGTGYLDSAGTSRWYRFAVQPGARATVALTGLPANYDLAVFTDIGQAFEQLVGSTDVDGLNQLSAEYAPAVFSPAVFSPAVFSPAVFSPDAYSPAVFSPAVFSPAVFSPAVFSPAVFSPAVFSPAVFSPAVFSPAVFSPAVFSPAVFSPAVFSPAVFSGENYASAQVRSLAAVSASDGTADEVTVVDTWNNTGSFYVRVTGRNGAFDTETPFNLSVTVDGQLCAGVAPIAPAAPITAPANGRETVIVWDPTRMSSAAGNSAASMATLRSRLDQLAARPEVNAAIVDLGAYPHIQALHDQANAKSSCPYAANLTASAIKTVIDAYATANPGIKYVVLAGNDDQIPFFRYPDQALLGPEQNYDPPVADGTQSQSSLRLNYILGQDEYGSTTSLSLRDGSLPIPNLSVGRLVETASDMTTVIDAYLSTSNGVVTPRSSLVTGYDFLADSADAVQSELVAGMNATANVRNDTLVTAATISPADPRSWTADDLRAELLDEGEDIVFLAGHFSANSALAADYRTSVLTTELASSDVELTNALVFSGGCHSAYNIVDDDVVPGVTQPLDWTQAFAQKGATLVGGTGYQYGDTDFLEYSERLYALFARELRTGTGPITVGEALVRAKQTYLATTPELRALHYKSVLISSVFGLPMLSFDLQGSRLPSPNQTTPISPTPVAGGTPGAALGLRTAGLQVNTSTSLTGQTVELTNLDGGTLQASYLRGPDGVVTNPAEPAIPLVRRNVSAANQSLRGVGFRGGAWREDPVVPLTGAPTTELRGVHTPFVSTVNFPMRLARPNYYGALSGTGGTNLSITPVQHRVAAVGDTTATRRRFDSLDFTLYYSDNTQIYGANRPALSGPPTFTNVRAVTDGNDVVILARVVGDPAAGIQGVWATYTDGSGSSGQWVSLDLTQDPDDSTLWTGRLVGAAAPGAFGRLDYMVQAVNGVGLTTVDDNYGSYYQVLGAIGEVNPDGTPTVELDASSLALTAPANVTHGDVVTVSATLTSQGSAVAGANVVLSLGGSGRAAVTNAAGVATAQLPITATPGTYQLTASFAGDSERSASSDSASIAVAKAPTTLTLRTEPPTRVTGGVATGVSASLTDASGGPLPEYSVYFTLVGPGGSRTETRLTNNVGIADLGELDLADGTYTVTARFLGNIPIDGGTLVRTDPVYLPSTASAQMTIDSAGPTITFTGSTSYTVDQTVLITCTATSSSAITSTTCPTVASGPASSYPLGANVAVASATNTVGQTTTASVTFTVSVTAPSLCTLTTRSVTASAAYRALRPAQRKVIDALVVATCRLGTSIAAERRPRQRQVLIGLHRVSVLALQRGGFLTQTEMTLLTGLAPRL